jgi:surface protein
VFNQNVSNWNTGAVTNMEHSKCTRVLSLCWPRRLPLWCVVEFIYDNSRFVGSQVSHVLLFLCVCGLNRDLVVVGCVVGFGLSFLCCTLLSFLAVFNGAWAFNQDLSNWNTSAVTTMSYSKCTLSHFLSVTTAPSVVVCIDISRFVGSQVSHILFSFFRLWSETESLLLFVWWVWSFFLLLHPSLFLQCL